MTEDEWLRSEEPGTMLHFLKDEFPEASPRKLHLFNAACHRLNDRGNCELYQLLAETEERYADGLAEDQDLFSVLRKIGIDGIDEWERIENHFDWVCGNAYDCAKDGAHHLLEERMEQMELDDLAQDELWEQLFCDFESQQAHFLRDIVGNPFRVPPIDGSWRTVKAVQLAKAMYLQQNFAEMPVLGDLLESAGCDDAPILHHCRCEAPHTRGCWVVDFVLANES